MKILHVSDCFTPRLGGIERQVHDLALRQVADGHQVEIVTAVAGRPSDSEITVHRPSVRRGPTGTIQYTSWRLGRRTARTGDYDVVHIHASTWSPMSGMTVHPAVKAGIPTVVTVHSLWNRYWPLFSIANHLFSWNRYPVVWSAVSSVAAGPMEKHLRHGGQGGRYTPVELLPNAVDHAAWALSPQPRESGRVVIASVMRLAQRKRPHQYLEMLRQARELVPAEIALEAIIVGDGPRRDGLERYLARHKMTDWVTLYGRATHEQIREIYRDVDFFVAPATLESFGIAPSRRARPGCRSSPTPARGSATSSRMAARDCSPMATPTWPPRSRGWPPRPTCSRSCAPTTTTTLRSSAGPRCSSVVTSSMNAPATVRRR